MRIVIVALGTTLVLCNLGTFSAARRTSSGPLGMAVEGQQRTHAQQQSASPIDNLLTRRSSVREFQWVGVCFGMSAALANGMRSI
jgi:hypothetical protein